MIFTTTEKIACAERELRYRIRVYARLVAEGKISERQAKLEIALMGAIVDDYCKLRDEEQPKLSYGE